MVLGCRSFMWKVIELAAWKVNAMYKEFKKWRKMQMQCKFKEFLYLPVFLRCFFILIPWQRSSVLVLWILMWSAFLFPAMKMSSNIDSTDQKKTKTKLKKFLTRRPTLQAVREKGYIKGKWTFLTKEIVWKK